MPKRRRQPYIEALILEVLRSAKGLLRHEGFIRNPVEYAHAEAEIVMGKDKHLCILPFGERKSGYTRMQKSRTEPQPSLSKQCRIGDNKGQLVSEQPNDQSQKKDCAHIQEVF